MRVGLGCESRRQKVKKAQQLWNTQDPEKIALAYTEGMHTVGAGAHLLYQLVYLDNYQIRSGEIGTSF